MTRVRPDFEFLAEVAQRHGLDFARGIRDAIADGTLLDCGPCEWPINTQEITAPAKPADYSNPFPTWKPIPREPVEPPPKHLELAREIQQLKLGGVA